MFLGPFSKSGKGLFIYSVQKYQRWTNSRLSLDSGV